MTQPRTLISSLWNRNKHEQDWQTHTWWQVSVSDSPESCVKRWHRKRKCDTRWFGSVCRHTFTPLEGNASEQVWVRWVSGWICQRFTTGNNESKSISVMTTFWIVIVTTCQAHHKPFFFFFANQVTWTVRGWWWSNVRLRSHQVCQCLQFMLYQFFICLVWS